MSSEKYCSITHWTKHLVPGFSRSRLFECFASGDIRAVKLGRRTMVEVESGLAYMRKLPKAEFHAPKAGSV